MTVVTTHPSSSSCTLLLLHPEWIVYRDKRDRDHTKLSGSPDLAPKKSSDFTIFLSIWPTRQNHSGIIVPLSNPVSPPPSNHHPSLLRNVTWWSGRGTFIAPLGPEPHLTVAVSTSLQDPRIAADRPSVFLK